MNFKSRNTYYCICNEYPEEIKYFKEEWLCENIEIPSDKPDIDKICEVFINPIIIDTKLIDTESGLSNEGQILSGKKLITEILFEIKITYIADEPTQGLFSLVYNVKKSIFIILPEKLNSKNIRDIYKSSRLTVTPFVEHYYSKEINPRCFNLCILLFLDAQIC